MPKIFKFCGSILALAGLSLLGGCASDQEPAADTTTHTQKDSAQISWFEGSVEQAFSHAESAGKPVFLYWGAEWCPPCHYLKNKIFKRPEFLQKMEGYVAVYLDGDTHRAQVLGEDLDVKGYPTVIIFSSAGNEIMRMSSSIPVDQYATVLDSAVSETRPVQEVLKHVLDIGPAKASPAELNLLANYSWGQASELDYSDDELLRAAGRLFNETAITSDIERSRFLSLYLQQLAQAEGKDDADSAPILDAQQRGELTQAVIETLEDTDRRNANIVWVSYGAKGNIEFLAPEPSTERTALIEAWETAARSIEADEALTVDDRIGGTLARVHLARLSLKSSESEEIPTELQNHVRDQIAWAVETVDDESQLQSLVNTMTYILQSAGLEGEAEDFLLARMNDTKAPYYFMSWLADLKEESGDTKAALEWHKNAYENSTGQYSRFRYGSIYLVRLMELEPGSVETIETDSLKILAELLTFDDAFAGGNYSRLNGLETGYRDWVVESDRDGSVDRIRDLVQGSCGRYPAGSDDEQHERCVAFLSTEPEATEVAM